MIEFISLMSRKTYPYLFWFFFWWIFIVMTLCLQLMGDAGGQRLEKIMETWEQLQIAAAILYNGQLTSLMPTQKKPIRGFYQRLKGKQGRFRGNLSGKLHQRFILKFIILAVSVNTLWLLYTYL